MMSSNFEDRTPKLKYLRAADILFQNVGSYEAYHLPEKSQTYKEAIAASTGMYVTQMKTLTKAYKFDNKNSATALQFPPQLKTVCRSNGVFEDNTLCKMPNLSKNYRRAAQ